VTVDVRLQPEKEAQLAQIAAQRGLKIDELARQAVSRYREDDTRFIDAVNLGIAAADGGEFVEHEEVGVNIQKILRP
jgi:predicted transcriptional regulator